MDFATRADLTGRLRGLVILLDDRLSSDQIRRVEELVDASEFGVALQTLAEMLSEEVTPISDELRSDFQMLASKLEMNDLVMRPLDRCPVEEPKPSDGSDFGLPF